MKKIITEILVIGGGATGAGILRDLAMRGFKAVLVEKSDLTAGTTGRYHGLLHSGGRYVVKDPQAARECILENRILRKIMPQCIEDTGGFFVLTPWDDPTYAEHFVAGCQQAGIPVEEISPQQMLREEPRLNPRIIRCFRVPDGSADSFLATELNVVSARQYGAQAFTYHPVIELLCDNNRVVGARCRDLQHDELVEIHADLVVNAAGAWAGKIAALAGITVTIVPGKGVMLALNHRPVHTVINRCKLPADGDILVPAHTVAVIGTTDVKVTDPDHFSIEPWEIHLMLQEGEKLVPGFQQMRLLRAWAGVRPLYAESSSSAGEADNRDMTRAFVLLDHEIRDGVSGLITITSGKWTTYRLMAEATTDLVCRKLGLQRKCRTHLESLPSPDGHAKYHTLGMRLHQIEKTHAYGQLICECELVSRQDILNALPEAKTFDDIRRDTRLGMGPCQGGFCTYRLAGLWQQYGNVSLRQVNQALLDFLQERWKGVLPILWGQQLRQERLDELIYISLFNAPALPHLEASPFAPQNYQPASDPWLSVDKEYGLLEEDIGERQEKSQIPRYEKGQEKSSDLDVLVIGAGLSGLVAAWQAAARGLRVRLIAKGWGSQYWHAGCIDLLSRTEQGEVAPGASLEQALLDLIQAHPDHPYARIGVGGIRQSLLAFQELCADYNYPMIAMSGENSPLGPNWLLPSALGVPRPTCLAPVTMVAGDLRQSGAMLIIGFHNYHDFYPHWAAANLREIGIQAQAAEIDFPGLEQRNFLSSRILAEQFESSFRRKDGFLNQFAERLKRALEEIHHQYPEFRPTRIGLPAVLGFLSAQHIQQQLESEIGLPIFEIPTLPPSIPGMRLTRILVQALHHLGGEIAETGFNLAGSQVVGTETEVTSIGQAARQHLRGVWSEAASRRRLHTASHFILATGGFLGGGLEARLQPFPPTEPPSWATSGDSVSHVRAWEFLKPADVKGKGADRQSVRRWQAELFETACQLPLSLPVAHSTWLQRDFPANNPHPIFRLGIPSDDQYRPLAPDGPSSGQAIYDNLHVVGAALHGYDTLWQGSLEGVALASAYHLVHQILNND